MKIPYFDAHCDTIYRCEETGCSDAALEMGTDQEAQEAYYAACGKTADILTWCEEEILPGTASFSPCIGMRKTLPQMGCRPSAGDCTTDFCMK